MWLACSTFFSQWATYRWFAESLCKKETNEFIISAAELNVTWHWSLSWLENSNLFQISSSGWPSWSQINFLDWCSFIAGNKHRYWLQKLLICKYSCSFDWRIISIIPKLPPGAQSGANLTQQTQYLYFTKSMLMWERRKGFITTQTFFCFLFPLLFLSRVQCNSQICIKAVKTYFIWTGRMIRDKI